MLRFADYDIVFQEVPDETTLALNISGCPHLCAGCHSPQLRTDIGEPLTPEAVDKLLARYPYVTCVGLMGGDGDLETLDAMARYIRSTGRKVAWYTGMSELPEGWHIEDFDYIKVGPYVEALGGLKSKTTNQRFYRVENGTLVDNTFRFHQH
ncbi:MAG: 4Fe-4S cluster-binding domain-containing protein [Paludibacteraceae bacterium]